jgi:hypothetical protein
MRSDAHEGPEDLLGEGEWAGVADGLFEQVSRELVVGLLDAVGV